MQWERRLGLCDGRKVAWLSENGLNKVLSNADECWLYQATTKIGPDNVQIFGDRVGSTSVRTSAHRLVQLWFPRSDDGLKTRGKLHAILVEMLRGS
jgi:hypothetical protein